MALIRVAQYNSTPTAVSDYQSQNAHLQAFTNQLMTQQFILDSGTAQPVIKQGCYISHGGSLYIADADTAITGSPADGSVYIRVSGTTSLTVEFVTDISGYAWNPVYTALTSGSYTLLPYLIVKAGTSWTRYNFNPNNQAFGNAIIDGHDIDSELDTLNGRVNQGVNTTSSPTFASVNTGYGANEVYKRTHEDITVSAGSSANLSGMQIMEAKTFYVRLESSGGSDSNIRTPTTGNFFIFYFSTRDSEPKTVNSAANIQISYTSGSPIIVGGIIVRVS